MGTNTRKSKKAPKIPARRVTHGWGWLMSASPIAWITLGITMAFHAGTIGYIYSNIQNQIDNNKLAVERNDRRDIERYDALDKMISERFQATTVGITRLDANLHNMAQLRTDVEVMKNSLTTISQTLARFEQALEKANQRAELPRNMPVR